MVTVICGKGTCAYEMTWVDQTFLDFEIWMQDYIDKHSQDMNCEHSLVEKCPNQKEVNDKHWTFRKISEELYCITCGEVVA